MHTRKLYKIILCLFISALSVLCSCTTAQNTSYSTRIYALDTVIDITAYGENAHNGVLAATDEIYRLEKLLSVTDEKSEIYRLNNSKGKTLSVSEDTYNLLTYAKEISAQTQGMFDPTIYPVLRLWGFTREEYTVPSPVDIKATLGKVDYNNITLSENNTVSLQNDAEVDLGGIAKGYIADKAAEALIAAGYNSGLISLGGNVRTIGKKPQGKSWSIGIKSPYSNDYFATLSADDCSLITSGAYQRQFTADGVTYHHIIDPHTGYPSASEAVSVTVIGKDGAACDALSTAIFAEGLQLAKDLKNENFQFIILTDDGKVYVSSELKDSFSLADNTSSFEVIYI